MKTVVIHIGREGEARRLAEWLHADVLVYSEDVFEKAFREYQTIVAIMACGIVVRKISGLISDKWVDPAVLVVSPDLRYVIPLLGGHHGANDAARKLSENGLVPVITTATDSLGRDSVEEVAGRSGMEVVNKASTVEANAAFLEMDVPVYNINGPAVVLIGPGVSVLSRPGDYVIGIGCNRGTTSEEVIAAVESALMENMIGLDEVLAFATTAKKADEGGLVEGVRQLGGRLFFVDDMTINAQEVESGSKAGLIGLIGVSEPSALALAKRKELVMKRRAYGNVTVAIAK